MITFLQNKKVQGTILDKKFRVPSLEKVQGTFHENTKFRVKLCSCFLTQTKFIFKLGCCLIMKNVQFPIPHLPKIILEIYIQKIYPKKQIQTIYPKHIYIFYYYVPLGATSQTCVQRPLFFLEVECHAGKNGFEGSGEDVVQDVPRLLKKQVEWDKNGVYRPQKPENPENPGFNNYYFVWHLYGDFRLNNTLKFLIGSSRSGLA